MNICTRAARFL